MSIKIEKLTIVLGNSVILNDLNLEIRPNQVVAILGPNGSGKTTLLRTLLRLIEPSEGVIYIDGKDLKIYSRKDLAKLLSYVPQEYSLTFPYRVIDVVVMGITPYMNIFSLPSERDYIKAMELLKKLGIEHLAYRTLTTLSGGEKKLVLIARALMQKPKIILFDEPTANLDSKTAHRIIDLMQKINSEHNTTFVFATHDERIVSSVERLITLVDGEIVKDERKGS